MLRTSFCFRSFVHRSDVTKQEFNPDLVIVLSGFDSAKGDVVGNSDVTPVGYANMLQMVKPLAGNHQLLFSFVYTQDHSHHVSSSQEAK